jgi:hypothetical protein
MGLSGSLLIVQARRVVMPAQVIVMTVQMTTYEQKDNCEPDGLSPQSAELTRICLIIILLLRQSKTKKNFLLTINTLGVRIINPLNTISF